jgi:hypothetical protein
MLGHSMPTVLYARGMTGERNGGRRRESGYVGFVIVAILMIILRRRMKGVHNRACSTRVRACMRRRRRRREVPEDEYHG